MLENPVTWAALVAAVGVLVSLVKAWNFVSDRINKARTVAEQAKKEADEAREQVRALHTAHTTLHGLVTLHREQVAREYIHREAMREVEDRLTKAIDRLGDRLDNVVRAVLEAALPRKDDG